MVSGSLELLEIMEKAIDSACSILVGIKNRSLLIGTTGGIRFLFVLISGSPELSSTDLRD
jgi:hypothetical protein